MRHLTLALLALACSGGGISEPDWSADRDWTPVFEPAPVRQPCSPDKLALVQDTTSRAGVLIDCDLTLPAGAVVERQLILDDRSSGVTVACNGAVIGAATATPDTDTVIIRSRLVDGEWRQPHDVELIGCVVHGSVRLRGAAINGEDPEFVRSSHRPAAEHVAYMRDSAPYHVQLDSCAVIGVGRVPVYLGPGTHHSGLIRSLVRGRSGGPLVYLDAESTHNHVLDCQLSGARAGGPAIAVDASSGNRLERNQLTQLENGGVYLYRCHRSAAERVTTSSRNRIIGNRFTCTGTAPALWQGSREWWPDCAHEYAVENEVADNQMGACTVR